MKFQFLPENFSRSENAPPFETRKIRQFEVERIFLENKKMVHEKEHQAGLRKQPCKFQTVTARGVFEKSNAFLILFPVPAGNFFKQHLHFP